MYTNIIINFKIKENKNLLIGAQSFIVTICMLHMPLV